VGEVELTAEDRIEFRVPEVGFTAVYRPFDGTILPCA
jgi:hypothetical protein